MSSSIFQIFAKRVDPNYTEVWRTGSIRSSSGAGVCIMVNVGGTESIVTTESALDTNIANISSRYMYLDTNFIWNDGIEEDIELNNINSNESAKKGNGKMLILTAYHIVANAFFINSQKANDDKKYRLKVFDVAPHYDLALLDAVDEEFWRDVVPLNIGSVPKKGEKISAVGFPGGGNNCSMSSGIISRVCSYFSNKEEPMLALQVDAPLNDGNSGGPILDSFNQIVGIAFASDRDKQNMCFAVPSFLIKNYLRAIAKYGKYMGICDLDIKGTKLENRIMKEYYTNIPCRGILVVKIQSNSMLEGILQKDDIIISLDGINITDGNSIYLNKDYQIVSNPSEDTEKIPSWHILRMKIPGETLTIGYIRNNQRMISEVVTKEMAHLLIPRDRFNFSTNYYIFQGLIFVALNCELLQSLDSNSHLLNYSNKNKSRKRDEVIILTNILETDNTTGYTTDNEVLKSINDIAIRNMHELYQLCEKATGKVKFEFKNSTPIIVLAEGSEKSEFISQQYLKVPHTNFCQ
jgi:hypothetical protein